MANILFQVKYDFHQLPEDALDSLRSALLELLLLYAKGPRVILLQICIAIALLGLQMKTWSHLISDVVAVCSTSSDLHDALLQFLTVLPEEATDERGLAMFVMRA